MTSILRPALQTAQKQWTCRSCTHHYRLALQRHSRWSSTETAPPALLSKLKGDLKAAMKAKDAPRLNVLRAIISEVNNASKTAHPVTTDLQILALLKKRKSSSVAAQTEAHQQNREDLATKQQHEIEVMDEYASTVTVMTAQEIRDTISAAVEEIRAKAVDTKSGLGLVLKEIFRSGGVLDGKTVEKSQVVKVINELLGAKSS